MSLTELLQAIEREAEEELERARAQAEAEAHQLRERARADAAALEERLARAGGRAARREAEAVRSAARLDAARVLRSAHEEAWRETAKALRRQLAAQPARPEWPRVLTALVEEARSALPAGVEAHVAPADVELAQRLAPDLRVLGDGDASGGVVLSTDDGRRLDNTLDARLAAAEPLLRRRLAELLAAAASEVTVT